MPEPISSATVNRTAKTGADAVGESGAKETAKQGPSKFDEVRQTQQAQQTQAPGAAAQIPQLKTQLTPEQKKVAEADLRKRLDSGGANPQAIFKPDMKSARVQLDALHRKAQAVPAGSSADTLRDRLNSLDKQFQDSGKILDGMSTSSSPGDMLKFQMQMYQFTQNMQLMSKTVEEVSGGAKQILQTQV